MTSTEKTKKRGISWVNGWFNRLELPFRDIVSRELPCREHKSFNEGFQVRKSRVARISYFGTIVCFFCSRVKNFILCNTEGLGICTNMNVNSEEN